MQYNPIGSTSLLAINVLIYLQEEQAIKSPWEPRNKTVINLLPIYFTANKTLFRDTLICWEFRRENR